MSASLPMAKIRGVASVELLFKVWGCTQMTINWLNFLFFPREPIGLSVFSDDETDLIRELQTMCSSKSEPDISKVRTHGTLSSP